MFVYVYCVSFFQDHFRVILYGSDGGVIAKLCLTLVTLRTVARQAPLSMGFPRQEHWSGLPFPSPVVLYTHTNFVSTLIMSWQ